MEGSEGEVLDRWKIIRDLEKQIEEWILKSDEQLVQKMELIFQLEEKKRRSKARLMELNQDLVEKYERLKELTEELGRNKTFLSELEERKSEVEEMEERKRQLEEKKTSLVLALEEQEKELKDESTLKALNQQLEEEEEEYEDAREKIPREAKLWREQMIERLNTEGDNEVQEKTSQLLRKEREELRRWTEEKPLLEEQRERFERETDAEQQVVEDLRLSYQNLKQRIVKKKAELRSLREQEQQNIEDIRSLREELSRCSAAQDNIALRIKTFRKLRPSRSARAELQLKLEAARISVEQLQEAQQQSAVRLKETLQESSPQQAKEKTGRLLQFLEAVAPPP